VPAQIARRNVAWRTLGYMLLGGVPGVLLGSMFLRHLVTARSEDLLDAFLGAILVGTAGWQIFYSFRPVRQNQGTRDRSPLLLWLMFPVGAEVGFSSAGAGALGSAALLSLTSLAPAQVVGTDIVFGFLVSLIGGAHWISHPPNAPLLLQMTVGGIAGAIVGSLLSSRIPSRPLRFVLWVWLLILGGQFLCRSYQMWVPIQSMFNK
jgi:uncharacterized membrane protein YfcA